MNRTSRTDAGPSLARGRVEGAALRAAVGTGRRSPFRRFTLEEAAGAASALADDVGLDPVLAAVGVALDLRAARNRKGRAALRQSLGLSEIELEFMEMTWELVEPRFRFDLTRRAVRIVMARRIGGLS